MKRIVIQGLLFSVVFTLAYMVWYTIQKPISFEKEKKIRYDLVIRSLNDIRSAQLAFKNVNGRFCGDWDSLIAFIKTDSIIKIRSTGMLTDSMLEAGIDEKEAVAKGLIKRDTLKVSVFSELFAKGYPIETIGVIPTSNGERFWLRQATLVTGSGLTIPVFEARAHNNQIFFGLAKNYKQEIINLNEQCRVNKTYPGLTVGSINEPNNNSGNWE